jgi:beta-xylosidase
VASTYKIVLGRSSSLKGPYVDKNNTPMLSGGGFKLDTGDTRWKGPGGASIFIEHDTAFCVNHAYDANNNGSPTMMIRPLYWDSNNWPTFTKPPVLVKSDLARPNAQHRELKTIFCNSAKEFRNSDPLTANHSLLEVYSVTGKKITAEFLEANGSSNKAVHGVYIVQLRNH